MGMDAIAAAAEVTKKTVYDRYGSKEELVTAYLTQRDGQYRKWVAERAARHPDDADRQLLSIFPALAEWMSQRNARGCAFINAFAELPDAQHRGHVAARAQKDWLRAHLAGLAVKAGAHRPDTLAQQLLALHEGAIIAFSVGGDPEATIHAEAAAATLLGASRA